MRVAVLGASGRTGMHLVRNLLSRGHFVTAIVRNPHKVRTILHENLRVVVCDIFDSYELAHRINGHHAVMSCIGGAPWVYPESIYSIADAMKMTGIRRFICVTSLYNKPGDNSYPEIYWRDLYPSMGETLDAMYHMEEYIFRDVYYDLSFTIVRSPRLSNEAWASGQIVTAGDRYAFPKHVGSIPRSALANFMVDCLEQQLYMKRGVAISYQY